jgi:hypothetical protein
MTEQTTCVYSFQKPMGSPRKRRLQTEEDVNIYQSISETVQQQTSSIQPSLVGSAIPTTSHVHFDLPALQNISEIDLLDPSVSGATSACACLSSLYLTLDNLRTRRHSKFPSGL